jgi:hypothetical protein
MPSIIVDPYDYDKRAAYEAAKILCVELLDANSLSHPTFDEDYLGRRGWAHYGLYRCKRKLLCVNVRASKLPVKTPGFAWSYTGYKADLTAPGVTAHELGHHIWNVMRVDEDAFAEAIEGERAVSSYEPITEESFAEACKLFVLNPDLLRQGRPKRYEFFTVALGLAPVVTETWDEILIHAHDRLIDAAAKFANCY